MVKAPLRKLSQDQANSIAESLELIAAIESPLTHNLMIWAGGLRLGLGYHGLIEQQDEALEELDSLQGLRYNLEILWAECSTQISRLTSDPETWANALSSLEGGPHDEHDALEFAAESIARKCPGNPQDIALGLYVVSLLFQKDRLIRREYLEFADSFSKSIGLTIPIDHDRLFGPWMSYGLAKTVDTTGLHRFETRLEAVRNEVDIAALRAIAGFHLWQTCQLAKASENPSRELRHLYEISTNLRQGEYSSDLLPDDIENQINKLKHRDKDTHVPFIPWSLSMLGTLPFKACEPLVGDSPSTFAARLFTKNARLIFNQLIPEADA